MKRNELKDTVSHQAISQVDSFLEICDLLNQGDDEAANDAFDESYLAICELLNQVDFEAVGDAFDEDFSDIGDLRARLRKESLQGLFWIIVGVCLILSGFAIVS